MKHFDVGREFQVGHSIGSNSFQKIDKISYAQLLCMVCCSVWCIVYNINRVYVSWIRPFMYVLGWVCRVWGELVKSVYTIKRFESDRKWWCDKIYKNTVSFQFVHKLVPNLFKLIKINGVSIIIYCSLFFFWFHFSIFVCEIRECNNNISFFGRVWLYFFYLHNTFLWQGHSLKFCMTASQLMRVINDVRIINIDNWI